MAFWGDTLSADQDDPKRKFRWRVSFGGVGGGDVVWFAKTVSRPEMTIADTEHKFYGHTFKYPGSVTWNDIEIELVDPVSPDAAKQTLDIFHRSGYRYPNENYKTPTGEGFKSMTKGSSVEGLKSFEIKLLNGEGVAVETWNLHNAFLSKIAFDQLDYAADDLTSISLTVKYDWAKFTGAGGVENIFVPNGGYTPSDN